MLVYLSLNFSQNAIWTYILYFQINNRQNTIFELIFSTIRKDGTLYKYFNIFEQITDGY